MKKKKVSNKYYHFSNSIRVKYLAYMLLAACLIFTVLLMYNYYLFKSVVRENADLRATKTTKHIVSSTNSFLLQVVKVVKGIELDLQKDRLTDAEIEKILKDAVYDNEEIHACRAGFEPLTFHLQEFSLLTRRTAKLHPSSQIEVIPDDFTHTDEYIQAVSRGKSFFIVPHREDALDSANVFAYIIPVSRTNRNGRLTIKGAVCIYISVNWFNEWLKEHVDFDDGFVAVMGPKTELVAYNKRLPANGNSLMSIANEKNYEELKRVAERIMNHESGWEDLHIFSSDFEHFSFEPLQVSDWSVAVSLRDGSMFKDSTTRVYTSLIKIETAGLILLALVFFFIIRRITRPLERLADSTNLLSKGNFDVKLPLYEKRDEVGRLTYSMQVMIDRLKDYFEEMLEKERLEGELRVAKEIQDSVVPRLYPAFPQNTAIDVYGRVEAAKEIGGDFFDYVLCKERYLYFVIGDVSGTGVPASLLMTVARTLFRSNACLPNTGEMAVRINREFCLGNETNMFVTLFIGALDSHTGILRYTNAGHNYPLLKRANGELSELKQNHGVPLGMLDTLVYRSDEVQLFPDDILLLYTDGVNEARQDELYFFGVAGIEKYLQGISSKESVYEITNRLFEKVREYSAGNETYADDITVLTVKYRGNGAFENED